MAVNAGNERTEFTYDGEGRLFSARKLINGSEVSLRKFVWCDNELCEERDAAGGVTKRFYQQGVRLEAGPKVGNYFYTRDHLGSIRELTDGSGSVRARYAYDPYGRRTRLSGDLEADFGFTGMFWAAEAELGVTRFRAYDPELGRWLSRDPLRNAEVKEGLNLYAYVHGNPVNRIDRLGLCCEMEKGLLTSAVLTRDRQCQNALNSAQNECANLKELWGEAATEDCVDLIDHAMDICDEGDANVALLANSFAECLLGPCELDSCKPPRPRCGAIAYLGPLVNISFPITALAQGVNCGPPQLW